MAMRDKLRRWVDDAPDDELPNIYRLLLGFVAGSPDTHLGRLVPIFQALPPDQREQVTAYARSLPPADQGTP